MHTTQKDLVIWPAPCKLNLFLHITGRRTDGYHTLQTIFQLLDYGDELTFEKRADHQLVRKDQVLGVAAQDDLMIRAAAALRAAAKRPELGVTIGIQKKIPQGAGLGGGSSDAATTLIALNCLWELAYSRDELAQIGIQLGADVPLFVHGKTAWGEGVGEILTPLTLPELWFLVVTPQCEIATAEIFGDPGLTRGTPSKRITRSYDSFRNDCEIVVRDRFSQVDQAMNWLSRFGKARLTGTGSSVFAQFADKEAATAVLHQMPAGYQGFVARGVNESALNQCDF